MDDTDRWLFDPPTTRRLVLAHRCEGAPAVSCVVSDVVWGDVVTLLRWARADPQGPHGTGVLWRLAAGCGDLLRRLPALSDEIAEPWQAPPAADLSGQLTARARLDRAARRLARLLRSPGPVHLQTLAREVDALGDAAIRALVVRAAAAQESA
jgi:hypothetical protein